MNADELSGKLVELKGEIKKTWGKLTDDEIQIGRASCRERVSSPV